MISHAPVHHSETAPLDAPAEGLVLDVVRLLDHRTRERLRPQRRCRRGPHLACQDADETLMLELTGKITHLGRGLTADIRIEDPRISRAHAIIVRHGRFVRLLDNRSANGTYVNGRRVIATNLSHGDVVRVGPVAMQYLELA